MGDFLANRARLSRTRRQPPGIGARIDNRNRPRTERAQPPEPDNRRRTADNAQNDTRRNTRQKGRPCQLNQLQHAYRPC